MSRCEDAKMRRWEDDKTVKMRADVKMSWCEDEKMWSEDAKMKRCEVKMWRCENARRTHTIRRTLRADAPGKRCSCPQTIAKSYQNRVKKVSRPHQNYIKTRTTREKSTKNLSRCCFCFLSWGQPVFKTIPKLQPRPHQKHNKPYRNHNPKFKAHRNHVLKSFSTRNH